MSESDAVSGQPGDSRAELLNAVWSNVRAWTPDTVPHLPAGRRALDSGADPADLVAAMRAASYEAAFALLFLIGDGNDQPLLAGLHEELLMSDPTGAEGQDFLT